MIPSKKAALNLYPLAGFFALCALAFLPSCNNRVEVSRYTKFSAAIGELKTASSALSLDHSVGEAAFKTKAFEQHKAKKPGTEAVLFLTRPDDPLSPDTSKLPSFQVIDRVMLNVGRILDGLAAYSKGLEDLANPSLVDPAEFTKNAELLNTNIGDALKALDVPAKPAEIALFSTVAVTIAEGRLNAKRKNLLRDTIQKEQPKIEKICKNTREAMVALGMFAWDSYNVSGTRKQQALLAGNIDDRAERDKLIDEMVALNTELLSTIDGLRILATAIDKIPVAHRDLTKEPHSSATIAAIVTDAETFVARFEATNKVNEVRALKALITSEKQLLATMSSSIQKLEIQKEQLAAEKARLGIELLADPESDAIKKQIADVTREIALLDIQLTLEKNQIARQKAKITELEAKAKAAAA